MGKRKLEIIDLTEDDEENRFKERMLTKSAKHSSKDDINGQNPINVPCDRTVSVINSTFTGPESRSTWCHPTQLPTASQINDSDMRREIDLTQDSNDSSDTSESYQLYGILKNKIVGCRYYDGRATVGEHVIIRREPQNPYDHNAIRIDNVIRQQIGHLSRAVAAKLAPLIDSGELKVEGELIGYKTSFDCPIGLKLFGSSDSILAAQLKQKMQDLGLPINELNKTEKEKEKLKREIERQRKAREKAAAAMKRNGVQVFDSEGSNQYSNLGGIGNPNDLQHNLQELLESTVSYNPRELQDMVSKFGFGEDALAGMDMVNQPDQIATQLLPHQRQGLKWMLDHESPKLPTRGSQDIVQLWKNSNGIYSNIATNFSISKAPDLASGGILADDMGMGKTLQIISLVIADPKQVKEPTLIITPLSVMTNWRDQAMQHVKTNFAPKVLIYHCQGSRGLSPDQFYDYDIVITTYQTMTIELFPNGVDKPISVPSKNGLYSVNWRRVVLDEGHQIRNPKAKMSRAACALMSRSRWILTGTPIVNSLKDLYSHVKFLQLSGGLDEYEIFNSALIRPLKQGVPGAKILLQALMTTLCLRRMKDMKFVDLKLPGISFHKYSIQFVPHEKERYEAFKAEAIGLVEAAKAKKADKTMTHLLEVLLRLRQTCNHWKMCGEERVKQLLLLLQENSVVDAMKPENRRALQDLLQLKVDSQEECPVCMDTMSNPMITVCSHAFCNDCIAKVIETQKKCPMCRTGLEDPTKVLIPAAANFGEMESGENEPESIDVETTSSKIEALIKILRASSQSLEENMSEAAEADNGTTKKNVRPDKIVVFSQWTSFLDLIEPQLRKHNIQFVRLDGRMSVTKRETALTTFDTLPDVKVLLASLSVCSVGLNLVAANTVILADSWWAPAIEDQAIDRVYRLGQKKKCKVIRLIVEDTIEDEVLAIQDRKRKLAAEAFGEKIGRKQSHSRGQNTTLNDIVRLLQ